MHARLKRRAATAALLLAVVFQASAMAPAASSAATSWNVGVHSYDNVRIPRVFVTAHDPDTAPGYMFLTPRAKFGQRTGPTILDSAGRVVWFHRLSRSRTAINLQPQTYRGKSVITWGQRPPLRQEGDLYTGNAHTVYNVIADDHYRIIARVRAHGRGINTDLHEFQLTRRNTALVLGFRTVNRNLKRYGGVEHSAILDNVVQEIDIKTGRVLFSWSAARRISPRGSMVKPPKTGGWDAYHINSVSEDSDGNLLLTSRHLSAVYKINRRNGRVIWVLGGPRSTFKISRSARFYYPHDAARAADGTLTLFDNRSTFLDKRGQTSRGLRLKFDTKTRTVTLAGAFRHPSGNVLATSQGNARMIANGHFFVGWGSSPWFSEHGPDGHLVFAAHFQSQWNQSYRAFKGPWIGRPPEKPAVSALVRLGSLAVYAAWNGATQVAQWRVLAGDTQTSLSAIGTGAWTDFETKLLFPKTPKFVQVEALDAAGAVLGRSDVVAPSVSK